jgi:ketosteroid isomerase-like protein
MSTEDDVRAASKRFYSALNRMANGDAGPMAEVWLHAPDVTAMHPIGGRQVGWDEVRASFEGVAHAATEGNLGLEDQIIRVAGDTAYEMGVERGGFKLAGQKLSVELRVTNIYRRQGGGWKMVHHHTDTSPAMIDAYRKLQQLSGRSTK